MFKKNALISVYDKKGIELFAQGLVDLGWKIISSGGTARYLKEKGIPVTDVAEITGQPAILGHRVVTLAPQIHGGILASEAMVPELKRLGYPWIDLVCVDMYPLEQTVANTKATLAELVEQHDIGGPTMIAAAIKGGRIVVTTPSVRTVVLRALRNVKDVNREALAYVAAKHLEEYARNVTLARRRIMDK